MNENSFKNVKSLKIILWRAGHSVGGVDGTPKSGPIITVKAKHFFDVLGYRVVLIHHLVGSLILKNITEYNKLAFTVINKLPTIILKVISKILLPLLSCEEIYNANESELYWTCLLTRTLTFESKGWALGYI